MLSLCLEPVHPLLFAGRLQFLLYLFETHNLSYEEVSIPPLSELLVHLHSLVIELHLRVQHRHSPTLRHSTRRPSLLLTLGSVHEQQ